MKRTTTWCVVALAMLVGLTQGDAAPKSNLSDFMRVKLRHSQDVVEGLVLADFAEVEKNAQNMSLLSLAETWQVLQTPQYIEYSKKFRAAADALAEAARKKNLDKATEAYNVVTLRCVECHKYVRDVRMARLDVK